jgi:exodeoxyribonuclease VII large subunit
MRLAADLAARGERMTNRHRSRLDLMGTRLHALSPLATLERGFAVASDAKGRTLSSSAEFAAGMSFTLTLRDGSVAASVDDVTRLSSNKPSTP